MKHGKTPVAVLRALHALEVYGNDRELTKEKKILTDYGINFKRYKEPSGGYDIQGILSDHGNDLLKDWNAWGA